MRRTPEAEAPMQQDYSEQVKGLSTALRGMHKALMDAEFSSSPAASPHDQMQRLLHDPALQWLKPVSDLMVQLDGLLATNEGVDGDTAFAIRRRTEALFGPYEGEKQHAVQAGMAKLTYEHPQVTMALGDLRRVLSGLPEEAAPAEG